MRLRQLARMQVCTYDWWRLETDQPIVEKHVERLKQLADEHIQVARAQGYHGGDLEARLDGIGYGGWWAFKETEGDL